jgi:hypothetical protein
MSRRLDQGSGGVAITCRQDRPDLGTGRDLGRVEGEGLGGGAHDPEVHRCLNAHQLLDRVGKQLALAAQALQLVGVTQQRDLGGAQEGRRRVRPRDEQEEGEAQSLLLGQLVRPVAGFDELGQ